MDFPVKVHHSFNRMFKVFILFFPIYLARANFLNLSQFENFTTYESHEVNIEDYPYQVAVIRNGMFTCGGSIIDKNWILTASHCVKYLTFVNDEEFHKNALNDLIQIRAGSNRHDKGGVLLNVSEVHPHPDYDTTTSDFDFALLKLDNPLTFNDKIKAIPLSDERFFKAENVVFEMSGWGSIVKKPVVPSYYLRATKIGFIPQDICREIYENIHKMHPKDRRKTLRGITYRMICAGLKRNGACNGDSGNCH